MIFIFELTVSGKSEIINGFQTDSLIRISECVKPILFSGDYLSSE